MHTNLDFPDIALFVENARNILLSSNALTKEEKGQLIDAQLYVEIFIQTWGSTCLGIDITKDGSPAIGGSAMTDAYTTVVYEPYTGAYCVFFGNLFAYVVTDANETFLSDLRNRNLKSCSEASASY